MHLAGLGLSSPVVLRVDGKEKRESNAGEQVLSMGIHVSMLHNACARTYGVGIENEAGLVGEGLVEGVREAEEDDQRRPLSHAVDAVYSE